LAPKGLVIGRNIPISDQRLFSSFEDGFGSTIEIRMEKVVVVL
jgi:hypothetical protein